MKGQYLLMGAPAFVVDAVHCVIIVQYSCITNMGVYVQYALIRCHVPYEGYRAADQLRKIIHR